MSFVSMYSPTQFISTLVKHVDLQDCGLSKTFDTTFTIAAFVRLFPSVSVNVRLHVASTIKRQMTFFRPRRPFSTVGDYVLIHIVLNRKHLQCNALFGRTFLVLSCLATDNVEALFLV